MAFNDYNSAQPVRSESDPDQLVVTRISDGTTPNQNAAVDTDQNLHVESHGNDPAGVDRVVRLSEQGAMTPDGVYDATNNTKPGTIAVIAHERSASPGDATQTLRPTAVGGASDVVALDMALHDEDGNAYSESNPLPVSFHEEPGTDVLDYNQGAATAAGGTSTHTYTVTALKTLRFKQVSVSASGKAHFEIAIAPDGSTFAIKAVLRTTASCTNGNFTLAEYVDVPAGGKVRIIKTNQDKGAADLDSTILGLEV